MRSANNNLFNVIYIEGRCYYKYGYLEDDKVIFKRDADFSVTKIPDKYRNHLPKMHKDSSLVWFI